MARRSMGKYRRGGRRAPLRKFVWARTNGTLSGPGTLGADLLDAFQDEYGAQLLGATVVRVRGYAVPWRTGTPGPGGVSGQWGLIVESDNELDSPSDITNAPIGRPHDDWFAWQPFVVDAIEGGPPNAGVGSNPTADPWSVDIKSSRKIEELGQGLHIWYSYTGGTDQTVDLIYDFSIGLKLP